MKNIVQVSNYRKIWLGFTFRINFFQHIVDKLKNFSKVKISFTNIVIHSIVLQKKRKKKKESKKILEHQRDFDSS